MQGTLPRFGGAPSGTGLTPSQVRSMYCTDPGDSYCKAHAGWFQYGTSAATFEQASGIGSLDIYNLAVGM